MRKNTQRFWKLICLHLSTGCFIEISLQSTGQQEKTMQQYVGNANKLISRIFVYESSPSSTLPLVIPEYI